MKIHIAIAMIALGWLGKKEDVDVVKGGPE